MSPSDEHLRQILDGRLDDLQHQEKLGGSSGDVMHDGVNDLICLHFLMYEPVPGGSECVNCSISEALACAKPARH